MAVVSLDAATGAMTWLGVGNVEGILVRPRGRGGGPYESAPLRGGVVGFLLPPLRPSRLALERDDVVVLASDGIRAGFAEIATTRDGPQAIAERILAEHGRDSDDALVLVARYVRAAGTPKAPGHT